VEQSRRKVLVLKILKKCVLYPLDRESQLELDLRWFSISSASRFQTDASTEPHGKREHYPRYPKTLPRIMTIADWQITRHKRKKKKDLRPVQKTEAESPGPQITK
jgi:hypothetical protein